MIWLSWRQLRLNAAVFLAALAGFAVALALTGPHVADVYAESRRTFLDWIAAQQVDRTVYLVGTVAGYVVPVLIGMFWGAPMIARELEGGTHRLVWSQTVSRNRWLATKLGLGALTAAVVSGALGLALTWWSHSIDKAVTARTDADVSSIFEFARISPTLFASRGVAPIGYAVFAFVLGLLAGAVIRRTVPAMAVVLVVYVVLQIVMPIWVRPHLAGPVTDAVEISRDTLHGISGRPGHIERLDVGAASSGSWTLSNKTVDADGQQPATLPTWLADCLPPPGQEDGGAKLQVCFDRLADEGYRQRVVYQPPSHYWALQWRETAVLLGGSGILAGLTFWRVRRLS